MGAAWPGEAGASSNIALTKIPHIFASLYGVALLPFFFRATRVRLTPDRPPNFEILRTVGDSGNSCSPEEFAAYRWAVGRIMGKMLRQVLNPLYAEHP